MKEMVGGCCVCSDERGWPDNPLVYCDGNGCTVAVHQACYGIVTVPTGPWYCRKCESPDTKGKVKCELCPSKSGALKRTDTNGWAHVVCALYIPEVRFGNVTSMEPIVLRLIPPERYSKTCYICQDLGKTHRANAGACMQCNKTGCKQQFHVTCAQSLGLLCEEAGNYLDNVKYCGYCQHHYSKLKKGGNVKTIPPYKPVVHDGQSSDSSGEVGEGSPAGGGGTPTHPAKAKGPGRKTSHSTSSASGKMTPNAAKTPTNTTQPTDKKKQSPARRGSTAGDGSAGAGKASPAPSPQHPPPETITHQGKAGGSTPNNPKATPPAASPGGGKSEAVGVISSVPLAPPTSTPTSISSNSAVPQVVLSAVNKQPSYQESVITNTEAIDTKQTKKRKAITNAAQQEYQQQTVPEPVVVAHTPWEGSQPTSDMQIDMTVDKVVKKAKTDGVENAPSPSLPPPPPPQSPRHLPSPMPGPSGVGAHANIRSPSQPQMKEATSLLVSVPLPPAPHGLNLSQHTQVSAPSDMAAPLPHIYQTQKQATTETSVPSHSPHGPSTRAWAGLNVCYEMQQDPNKPGVSGVAAAGKDIAMMQHTNVRTKKRAAMAACNAQNNKPIPPTATQTLASVRRPPQAPPPPVYKETIKDSPPSSPGSERPLKQKVENQHRMMLGPAPHMLGNELNPDSGAAARLQEQLTAELAAHAAGAAAAVDTLHPPPLPHKPTIGLQSQLMSLTGFSRAGGSAQSLDQLLERQWEQGSHFLMEQAQHFDIASLLSCLHQLRTENIRLEEHVGSLLQRRDHLLAVNARLAIPLTADVGEQVQQSAGPQFDAPQYESRQQGPRPHEPRPHEPAPERDDAQFLHPNSVYRAGQIARRPNNSTWRQAPATAWVELVDGPGGRVKDNAVAFIDVSGAGPEPQRCPRESPGPRAPPPPLARPAETITSERSHQLMMREVQQKPS